MGKFRKMLPIVHCVLCIEYNIREAVITVSIIRCRSHFGANLLFSYRYLTVLIFKDRVMITNVK